MNSQARHILLAAITSVLTLAHGLTHAQTLRVGLAEDPDALDPTLARSFVGRIVFSSLCDKLFDIDEKLNIQPQLATSYEWSADSKSLTLKLRQGVTFHDGEKFDAAAVKFNIERHKTMAGSNRRGELAPVASVDVVDPATVTSLPLTASCRVALPGFLASDTKKEKPLDIVSVFEAVGKSRLSLVRHLTWTADGVESLSALRRRDREDRVAARVEGADHPLDVGWFVISHIRRIEYGYFAALRVSHQVIHTAHHQHLTGVEVRLHAGAFHDEAVAGHRGFPRVHDAD